MIPIVWLFIRSYKYDTRSKFFKSPFDRYSVGIAVCNFQKFVVFDPSVEVINDDSRLLSISIPPFTTRFVVSRATKRCSMLVCIFRLASAWRSPVDNELRLEISGLRRVNKCDSLSDASMILDECAGVLHRDCFIGGSSSNIGNDS